MSTGCWGSSRSPEYSPLASTPGSAGIPFFRAQAKFFWIWLLIRPLPAAHTMCPFDRTHCQGTTLKFCWQPKYAWVQVWLTQ